MVKKMSEPEEQQEQQHKSKPPQQQHQSNGFVSRLASPFKSKVCLIKYNYAPNF